MGGGEVECTHRQNFYIGLGVIKKLYLPCKIGITCGFSFLSCFFSLSVSLCTTQLLPLMVLWARYPNEVISKGQGTS